MRKSADSVARIRWLAVCVAVAHRLRCVWLFGFIRGVVVFLVRGVLAVVVRLVLCLLLTKVRPHKRPFVSNSQLYICLIRFSKCWPVILSSTAINLAILPNLFSLAFVSSCSFAEMTTRAVLF